MLMKVYNDHDIRWREDGFGCLTDMGKATKKNVSDWLRLKGTQRYINVLSSVLVIPATQLLQVLQGAHHEEQGTWGCKQLCLRFAQWCNPEFAVQVDLWVEEIMTKGVVDIRNLTPTEILHATTGRLVEMEKEQKLLQQNVNRVERLQIAQSQEIKTIDDKVIDLDDRNTALEAEMERVINPYGSYYTVLGYNNRFANEYLTFQMTQDVGRKASRLCRERNIPIEKVNDPRFGAVNSYPADVLEEVFNDG